MCDVNGHSICDFVRKIWQDPSLLENINYYTYIYLIPKFNKPEFVTQFRPISLCKSFYKTVSKEVVNCMKVCIRQLISPNQIGFILRRSIRENIVVA